MKVLFLTKYSQLGASSRYRSYQYLQYLSAEGLSCEVSPLFPDGYITARYNNHWLFLVHAFKGFLQRIRTSLHWGRYDLVMIEKELFPYVPVFFEEWLVKRARAYTLDFDDALFHIYDHHSNPFVLRFLSDKHARLMAGASLVTAGNSYIAEYATSYANRVEILPTVIDVEKYPILPEPEGTLTIGWIGTPITAKYLHMIREPLKNFLKLRKARLILIGAGEGFAIDDVPSEVLTWSVDDELPYLQRLHIGIMPLPDLPVERGKSGLKLLQYMACSRPVVASPVGVNVEIVNHGVGFLAKSSDEWLAHLLTLADDPILRKRMGVQGRETIEEHYSLARWAPKYAHMLQEVAMNEENVSSQVSA